SPSPPPLSADPPQLARARTETASAAPARMADRTVLRGVMVMVLSMPWTRRPDAGCAVTFRPGGVHAHTRREQHHNARRTRRFVEDRQRARRIPGHPSTTAPPRVLTRRTPTGRPPRRGARG